jgi:hypothetical protein
MLFMFKKGKDYQSDLEQISIKRKTNAGARPSACPMSASEYTFKKSATKFHEKARNKS